VPYFLPSCSYGTRRFPRTGGHARRVFNPRQRRRPGTRRSSGRRSSSSTSSAQPRTTRPTLQSLDPDDVGVSRVQRELRLLLAAPACASRPALFGDPYLRHPHPPAVRVVSILAVKSRAGTPGCRHSLHRHRCPAGFNPFVPASRNARGRNHGLTPTALGHCGGPALRRRLPVVRFPVGLTQVTEMVSPGWNRVMMLARSSGEPTARPCRCLVVWRTARSRCLPASESPCLAFGRCLAGRPSRS